MPDAPKKFLIADANILIDLAQAGELDAIRTLIHRQLVEIVMPRCVFDEISSEVTETDIHELGITLAPTTIEIYSKTAQMTERGLSRQDKTILLTAEEKGYAVWTNDKALGKSCAARGIEVFREFAILKLLLVHGFISRDALLEIARRVEEINPLMKGVSERLNSEI